METAVKEQTMPICNFVCISAEVKLIKAGRGVEFRQINDDGTLGLNCCFAKKNFRSVRVGGVYQMEMLNGTCRPSTLRYSTQWKDREQVMEWQASDAATKNERERKAGLSTAETKINLVAEAIEPLHRIYKRMDYFAQRGMESVVIRYLREGGKS